MIQRRKTQRNLQAEALEQRLVLSTITVTSLAEGVNEDGEVTLREAILAANADISVDGSETGDGEDRIVFADGLSGSIDLNNTLVITDSVKIIGNGASNTWITGRSGIVAFRTDVQDGNEDLALHLQDLRIRLAAAALSHSAESGTLTLRRVQIRNTDFGLSTSAETIRIVDSDITGNDQRGLVISGGSEQATLRVSGTRMSGNGISSVSGEREMDVDGLLYMRNSEPLSLLSNVGGSIINSTFTENTNRALHGDGTDRLSLSHLTIANNTGMAVDTTEYWWFRNSVIADNFDTNGEPSNIRRRHRFSGSFVSAYQFGDGNEPDNNGNVIGTLEEPLDAMLGPLKHNGGPQKTMLPLAGSPLIDTGVVAEESLDIDSDSDQRGIKRQIGPAPDRGAVEWSNGPRLLIAETRQGIDEGQAATINVSLLDPIDEPLTVQVETIDITTVAGRDYEPLSMEFTFDGTPGQSHEVPLTTLDDTEYELNEQLEFVFSSDDWTHLPFNVSYVTIRSEETSGVGLSGGVLLGKGSTEDDVIVVNQTEDSITATLSGETFSVAASLVEGIELRLVGGANEVTISDEIELPTTVVGGKGADTIQTGSGPDSILGSGGRDYIDAGEGKDIVRGGSGQDTIHGRRGGDMLYGDAGSDSIMGQGGHDLISGSTGADTLSGGDLQDTVWGGAGSDLLKGGSHRDFLYGFTPGSHADDEPGVDARNRLFGGVGTDRLWGGYAADKMDGGADDDDLYGFGQLSGGAGRDEIRTRVFTESFPTETELIGGPDDDTLSNSIQNVAATLLGEHGNDLLYGGGLGDLLIGDDGNDRLYGSGGNDTLRGGDGDDSVFGGSGEDKIRGGNDHDYINGGDEDDDLDGGGGRDVMVGGIGSDSMFGDTGEDILISGSMGWNSSLYFPKKVVDEWTLLRAFEFRQANLIDGSGSNDARNVPVYIVESGEDQNVVDDEEPDTIIGGNGTDWLIFNDGDDWTQ